MGIVQSLVSAVSPREDRNTAMAILAELDPAKDTVVPGSDLAFQYFPETITRSRSVDYVEKRGIGGSHPIYQWVSGSGRQVSFTAVFSRDEQPDTPQNAAQIAGGILESTLDVAQNPINAAINAVTTVAGNALNGVFGASGPQANYDKGRRYNVPIEAAIAWLESKTYPVYNKNNTRRPVSPPPKLLLYLPNSGIFSGVGNVGGLSKDFMTCLMTNCSIEYEAFFRSGAPRIVSVSLEFVETIQVGSSWKYISKDQYDKLWKDIYPVRDKDIKVSTG